MIDPDTFLTALYVQADDFFQPQDRPPPGARAPGRRASLSVSEVVTLGLFGQWFGFGGERGFWRWGSRHLRAAFPGLPAREQFNRLLRAQRAALEAFGVHLAEVLGAAHGTHEADKGFEGRARHARWQAELGVRMLCAPRRARGQKEHPWPKPLRRWLASIRQIVETVFDKLQHAFGLRRERPHCLQGFAARLAARVGLHNFCILLNQRLGRPNLAFADPVDW